MVALALRPPVFERHPTREDTFGQAASATRNPPFSLRHLPDQDFRSFDPALAKCDEQTRRDQVRRRSRIAAISVGT